MIVDFVLAPAPQHDSAWTEQRLLNKARLTVLGDKAYLDADLQALLRQRNALIPLTPPRANQAAAPAPAFRRALNPYRQAIETRHSQLAGQFHREQNKARRLSGLCARIQAKLAAHTLGLWRNCWLGRPWLALKDLAVI